MVSKTVAALVAWAAVQALLYRWLGFVGHGMLRHSIAAGLSMTVLLPFWLTVPVTAGVSGLRNHGAAAASSAALIAPFIATAVLTGLDRHGLTGQWFLLALVLLLLAASEEVLCRGFLMDSLSVRGSRPTGVLLSSAVFAALHTGNENSSPAGIANIFLAGVLLCLLRIATGGIWYPVLVHWLWNLMTGIVFGWSVSGHTFEHSLFRPASPPPWGTFGPEGSVLMTAGTLGGAALLLWKLRQHGKRPETA